MGLDTRVCRPHHRSEGALGQGGEVPIQERRGRETPRPVPLPSAPAPGSGSEQRGRGSLHLAQPPAVRWGGAGEGTAEEADGGDGLPEGVGADEHLGRAEPRLGVS